MIRTTSHFRTAVGVASMISGSILAAGTQTAPASEWRIAQRLDSGRVIVMLTSDEASITPEERDPLGPSLPKPSDEFLASFFEGVRWIPAPLGRRLTKSTAALGDRWALDGGRAGWFETSVNDFVLTSAGCFDVGAMMASVASSQRDAFSRVRGKYFVMRPMAGWSPPSGPMTLGSMSYAISQNDRAAIERLLQDEFRRTSPALLAELKAGHDASLFEAQRTAYARIAAGGAQLRFDAQAFRLTPDAFPRLFVRAIWTLDGKTAYAMSAWVRTAPALGIEQTDTHTAKFAFFGEFQYDPIEQEMNGEVLGVTDIDRDGLAEVLMLYRFYEGISIELQRYPSIGPGANAIAKFGAGC
jgi:hypothetical protein